MLKKRCGSQKIPMPLMLHDLQAAFAAYLVGEEQADLMSIVVGDTISAAARLRIHRHNMFHSLTAALGSTFSTVQTLVGENFFRALSRSFLERELPIQPVLAEYGANFPTFIESYEPAGSLPYLADMARLDWALNLAFHSPVDERLTAADLASVSVERMLGLTLDLAAGTAVVCSRFPIGRIWRASQPGVSSGSVDLAAGGACLLVLREPDDAAFVDLGEPEAAFVTALKTSETLEEAARAALAVDDAFDLSVGFARLLGFRAFAALR